MIDIHSHILHNLDDGPRTMEQSLELALMAVHEGVSTIIATPHHRNGSYMNAADSIIEAASLFQEQLIKNHIPLTVYHGQEIRVYPQMIDDYEGNSLLTLHGSSYMLIEFPPSKLPERIDEIFYELSLLHITPIIAHPERNREIADQPDKLFRLVEQGALSQITSHSINGLFGPSVQSLSLELCRRNLVHFLASDVHDAIHRPFHLQQAYRTVENLLGGDYVKYYQQNAERLIRHTEIERWKPIAKTRKGFPLNIISRIFSL
ncbi:tyrosine protein phosphatase [Paenibacillus sp. SYP-B3998]|uniref:Tyrosine-protein phosphatase n=1 Tax=Paenibacillus sp. SYP-B3998 TaxID=2678564 RepID=A0A6G3ZT02_9BACL|nr:CpsB/CapC family capsule biosynthesis tyrosine phosphatase [Paenibacillus sp. SYP-B3998]NEW04719.1 tyrosine protein phosphatase [Paenibacillus sp. SYP-B3998]